MHPNARAYQNIGGGETSARSTLKGMRKLVESVASIAYKNPRRVVAVDAVVEQCDVRMTRTDGVEVVLDVCIILRFDDEGRIVRLDGERLELVVHRLRERKRDRLHRGLEIRRSSTGNRRPSRGEVVRPPPSRT